MSAAGRGGKRDALDRYYTPDALAEVIVQNVVAPLVWHRTDRPVFVEPSAGGGAFARALAQIPRATVKGYDIDPKACEANGWTCADWLTVESGQEWTAHAVVGNPPYRDAIAHVEHSLMHAPIVVMLLRLALLEGQSRRNWWDTFPPAAVCVLPKRPSFTGGGTDAAAYGVFVWDRHVERKPDTEPALRWLDW